MGFLPWAQGGVSMQVTKGTGTSGAGGSASCLGCDDGFHPCQVDGLYLRSLFYVNFTSSKLLIKTIFK
jgi:hypothetical protein